jgi:DNA repair exonuclease SbcCD ATPase subunit
METEITTEELGQIVRAARVLSTDFDEEQIQSLSYAWQRLADSGFLDAVWGMTRLQREQGTSCSEALDANKELLKKMESLESKLAVLKEKVAQEDNKHNEATRVHQQLLGKIAAAKNEHDLTQTAIRKEQEQLSSFQERVENEKKRIEKELERCKKNAGITAKEIAAAGQLKAEVEKSGFNLEMMLGLAGEFASYQDAGDRLAEALKTGQTLTEYISTLEKKSEEKKRDIAAEIAQLVSQRNSKQSRVEELQKNCHKLEISLAQFNADVEEEQELRQFYVRYSPFIDLLEYLMSWNSLYSWRCDNPMCAPYAGITRFLTNRPASKCPYCGLSMIKLDPEPSSS